MEWKIWWAIWSLWYKRHFLSDLDKIREYWKSELFKEKWFHGKYLGNGWKYIVDLLSKLDILLSNKKQDLLLEIDPFLIDKVLAKIFRNLIIYNRFFQGKVLWEMNENSGFYEEETRMFSLVKIVEIAYRFFEKISHEIIPPGKFN